MVWPSRSSGTPVVRAEEDHQGAGHVLHQPDPQTDHRDQQRYPKDRRAQHRVARRHRAAVDPGDSQAQGKLAQGGSEAQVHEDQINRGHRLGRVQELASDRGQVLREPDKGRVGREIGGLGVGLQENREVVVLGAGEHDQYEQYRLRHGQDQKVDHRRRQALA